MTHFVLSKTHLTAETRPAFVSLVLGLKLYTTMVAFFENDLEFVQGTMCFFLYWTQSMPWILVFCLVSISHVFVSIGYATGVFSLAI